jgi:hypothetical protein
VALTAEDTGADGAIGELAARFAVDGIAAERAPRHTPAVGRRSFSQVSVVLPVLLGACAPAGGDRTEPLSMVGDSGRGSMRPTDVPDARPPQTRAPAPNEEMDSVDSGADVSGQPPKEDASTDQPTRPAPSTMGSDASLSGPAEPEDLFPDDAGTARDASIGEDPSTAGEAGVATDATVVDGGTVPERPLKDTPDVALPAVEVPPAPVGFTCADGDIWQWRTTPWETCEAGETCVFCDPGNGAPVSPYVCAPNPRTDADGFQQSTSSCEPEMFYDCDGPEDCPVDERCVIDPAGEYPFGECTAVAPCAPGGDCVVCHVNADCDGVVPCSPPSPEDGWPGRTCGRGPAAMLASGAWAFQVSTYLSWLHFLPDAEDAPESGTLLVEDGTCADGTCSGWFPCPGMGRYQELATGAVQVTLPEGCSNPEREWTFDAFQLDYPFRTGLSAVVTAILYEGEQAFAVEGSISP